MFMYVNADPQTLAAICRTMGIWDFFMLRPPGKYIWGLGNYQSQAGPISEFINELLIDDAAVTNPSLIEARLIELATARVTKGELPDWTD